MGPHEEGAETPMAKRVEALVKPELLVWAREDAALGVEKAAKKAQVSPERLESWETGERRPTIRQLRLLANAYKRPLALFYLPKPPKDFEPLRDFRRFPGELAPPESPELRFAVRKARDRREIALELYEQLEGELPKFSGEASLLDDPETLALSIRDLLGITLQDQLEFRGSYDAFNSWRSALENAGVLVFQASRIKLEEMRGFSIGERPFPVIVVNIKDFPVGRIFTMLHEFTHILLGNTGICDLEEEGDRPRDYQQVEIFSNRVAGATLVPEHDLLRERLVVEKGLGAEWSDQEILKLARRYRVSREVVLRRLLILERTTTEFYRTKRRELQEEWIARREAVAAGPVLPHRKAISSGGPLFTRLVLESYHRENITAADLSSLLNIRLKHLGRIERDVVRYAVESGALS